MIRKTGAPGHRNKERYLHTEPPLFGFTFAHCYQRWPLRPRFRFLHFLSAPSTAGRRSKQATKKPRQRSRRGQQRMHIAA